MKCVVKIDEYSLVYLEGKVLLNGDFMDQICARAGKNVYELIQDGGFSFDKITTYVGAASGPRWLVASGFDLSLLESEVMGNRLPVVLVGSSAGAMRFAAWTQPEPEKSYNKLIDAYISMSFTRQDSPGNILHAIRGVIDTYIDDDAVPFALVNKKYRLAIITARAKNLASFDTKWLQMPVIGTMFLSNIVHRRLIHMFFQRVVFHNSPIPPPFCLDRDFRGQAVALNKVNFKHAILASSAIPLAVTGVRDIYGAPNGTYRDGGLIDYHLNQKYAGGNGSITLMFNHQERVIPAWLDRKLKFRQPPERYLEDLLLVYPSDDFMRKLPYCRVPDREDFKRYVNNPSGRIRNWRRTVDVSKNLGETFLELVAGRKLRDVVKRI